MKVEYDDGGLLISPENDFETDFINKKFGRCDVASFVKCGTSAEELIGIKLLFKVEVEEDDLDSAA